MPHNGAIGRTDLCAGGVGRRCRRSEGSTHRTVPAQAATLCKKQTAASICSCFVAVVANK